MDSTTARLISLCVCSYLCVSVCDTASCVFVIFACLQMSICNECVNVCMFVYSQQQRGQSHLIKASYMDVLKALGEDRNVIRHV